MDRFSRAHLFAFLAPLLFDGDDPTQPGGTEDPPGEPGGETPPADPPPTTPPAPASTSSGMTAAEKKELEELRQYREQQEEARKKAEREKMSEIERAQAEAAEATARAEQAEARAREAQITAAVTAGLHEAGVTNAQTFAKLVPRTDLKISEEGVAGVAEAIERLREQAPQIFAQPPTGDGEDDEGGESSGPPNTSHPSSGGGKPGDRKKAEDGPTSDYDKGKKLAQSLQNRSGGQGHRF